MRRYLYLTFLAVACTPFISFGQLAPSCPPGQNAGADECADACILCDFSGLVGNTEGYTPSVNSGFCGAVENDQWFGFVAGGPGAVFQVTPFNCVNGNGLQMALYNECGGQPVYCEAGDLSPQPLSITASLTPGENYFLRIDGALGDQCEFNLQVFPPSAVQPPSVGLAAPILGLGNVCPGGTFTYKLPSPVAGASAYLWTAPPGSLINGQPSPVLVSGNAGTEVDIVFGTSGGQVCVIPQNACVQGQQVCKTVVVQPVPPTILPQVILCAEDLPFTLPWGDVAQGPGVYQWVYTSYIGCDSVVRVQVSVKPPIITNLGIRNVCPSSCFRVCDEDFCMPGSYSVVCTSYQGCDSIIVFTLLEQAPPERGVVYFDTNANGVRDPNEPAAFNVTVTTSSGGSALTNSGGIYQFASLNHGDTLRIPNPPTAGPSNPFFHVYDTLQPSCYEFGLLIDSGIVSGRVFRDNNGDLLFNSGDQWVPNINILVNGQMWAATNNNGAYFDSGLQDGDTITVELPVFAAFSVPAFYIYQEGQYTGYDFALQNVPGQATGVVFLDNNGNGFLNFGESGVPNVTVVTSSGALVTTDSSGNYVLNNLLAGDSIFVIPPGMSSSLPAFRVYVPNILSGYNFGLVAFPNNYDLSVSLNHSGPFRPGFPNSVHATVRNYFGPASGVELKVVLPDFVDILSFSTPPTQTIGDTLVWDIGTLAGGGLWGVSIGTQVQLGTPLGTQVKVNAWVSPTQDDLDIGNNTALLLRNVVGSFDPNDKLVDPAYLLPDMAALRPPLQYTVRFQNTGNFPADFVIIRDTLSEDLDLTSFRFLGASHPCTWRIHPGRVLEVDFQNINLPDSTSDEPNSHGFVHFEIRPAEAFPLGHIISNLADIFFDFNDPIRTNDAQSQVVFFLPSDGIPASSGGLGVRPNPAAWQLLISWKSPAPAGSRLTLYDLRGLPVLEEAVDPGANFARMDVSYLETGLYLLVYDTPAGVVERKQVVIARSGPVRRN